MGKNKRTKERFGGSSVVSTTYKVRVVFVCHDFGNEETLVLEPDSKSTRLKIRGKTRVEWFTGPRL